MAKVIENWVKFQKETFEKPEVRKIAKILGTHEVHAAAYCLAFWCYVDSHMREGFVPFTDRDDVDRFAHCEGFANALEEVGWARFEDDGVYIPNPDTHLTGGAKGRAEATARQHNHRAGKALDGKSKTDIEAGRPVTKSRDALSQKSVTREEKRREDPPPPTPSPAPSGTPAKAKQAEEEAEAVKSLGPEWGDALAAVQRAGPKAAAAAVLAASKLGHTPDGVKALVGVLERHRKLFAKPSGALVDRLMTVGPEVPIDRGWIVDIPPEPAAKQAREPTLEDRRQAFVADLKRRGVTGVDRVKALDEWDREHSAVAAG